MLRRSPADEIGGHIPFQSSRQSQSRAKLGLDVRAVPLTGCGRGRIVTRRIGVQVNPFERKPGTECPTVRYLPIRSHFQPMRLAPHLISHNQGHVQVRGGRVQFEKRTCRPRRLKIAIAVVENGEVEGKLGVHLTTIARFKSVQVLAGRIRTAENG